MAPKKAAAESREILWLGPRSGQSTYARKPVRGEFAYTRMEKLSIVY